MSDSKIESDMSCLQLKAKAQLSNPDPAALLLIAKYWKQVGKQLRTNVLVSTGCRPHPEDILVYWVGHATVKGVGSYCCCSSLLGEFEDRLDTRMKELGYFQVKRQEPIGSINFDVRYGDFEDGKVAKFRLIKYQNRDSQHAKYILVDNKELPQASALFTSVYRLRLISLKDAEEMNATYQSTLENYLAIEKPGANWRVQPFVEFV